MIDKTILVTGFAPYGEHVVNPAWEAVKRLEELSFDGYKLVLHQVPVTYKYVNEIIPELWKQHNPTFVMHVGVAKEITVLRLESLANRKPYVKPDDSEALHPTGEVCPAHKGPDVHYTELDVQRIIDEIQHDKLKLLKSTDAGLFLCEYIFYTSLNIDNSRALFTHVPLLDNPYTAEELAQALTLIINAALRQLQENEQFKSLL